MPRRRTPTPTRPCRASLSRNRTCSLRSSGASHGFARLLKLAGISMPIAQKLLRHSDPRLTANTYGAIEDGALHDSVNTAAAGVVEARTGHQTGHQAPDGEGGLVRVEVVAARDENAAEALVFQGIEGQCGEVMASDAERQKVERKRFELSTSAVRLQRSPS